MRRSRACRRAAAAAASAAAPPADVATPLSDQAGAAVGGVSRIPKEFGQLSYSRQYDHLFSMPLDVKKPVPKPDPSAQQV